VSERSDEQVRCGCALMCKAALVGFMAGLDIEIHATTVPPIFPTPFGPSNLVCPHGVLWFCEPTSDQRVRWAESGTP